MEMRFDYYRLTGSHRHWRGLAHKLRDIKFESRINEQGRLYGIWAPVFGLSYNQLVIMASSEQGTDKNAEELRKYFLELDGVEDVNFRSFEPTALPKNDEPITKPGLYINRWMRFRNSDIEEVVMVSSQAWDAFETAFDAKVQGFFRETSSTQGQTWILLKTWYPNFSAWHESRSVEKAGGSGVKFQRRAELTQASMAQAMELVTLRPT